MSDPEPFDAALKRMGASLRRAHTAFDAADEAFVEALEALKIITTERGTITERMTEMQESIGRLEVLVLTQAADIRTQADAIRALRQAIDRE